MLINEANFLAYNQRENKQPIVKSLKQPIVKSTLIQAIDT